MVADRQDDSKPRGWNFDLVRVAFSDQSFEELGEKGGVLLHEDGQFGQRYDMRRGIFDVAAHRLPVAS
jgi:hypothetical protein